MEGAWIGVIMSAAKIQPISFIIKVEKTYFALRGTSDPLHSISIVIIIFIIYLQRLACSFLRLFSSVSRLVLLCMYISMTCFFFFAMYLLLGWDWGFTGGICCSPQWGLHSWKLINFVFYFFFPFKFLGVGFREKGLGKMV